MSGDGGQQPNEWKPSMPVVPLNTIENPSIDALSKMPAAPKFSFGSKPKRAEDKDSSIPGPGSYFEQGPSSRGKSTPRFSFGAATRREVEKARVPGPGAYTPRSTFATTAGFSCTPKRQSWAEASKTEKKPGPGSHNVPGMMGLQGPRYSVIPRRKHDVDAVERRTCAPGPGAYDQMQEVTSQAKPPKWGFGTASRLPKMPDRSAFNDGKTPGPGAYRHTETLNGNGPKYSMRARVLNDKVGMLQEDV